EVRRVLYVIALGGIVIIVMSRFFASDWGGGRTGIEFGVIGNPNDYSCHLIAVLPFLLYMTVCKPSTIAGPIGRVLAIPFIGFGLYLIMKCGSRGALIALLVGTAYVLWKSPMRIRVAVLVAVPLIGEILVAVLPPSTIARLTSFSVTADASEPEEAV